VSFIGVLHTQLLAMQVKITYKASQTCVPNRPSVTLPACSARRLRIDRADQLARHDRESALHGACGRPGRPAQVIFFFLLCLFFSFCPHDGVFWANQISPHKHPFVDYFFFYLFLLNKYLLIQIINKSLIFFLEQFRNSPKQFP
jgi:hypothetical protein